MAQEPGEDQATLTIGQVARATGLTVSTVRFYEKEFAGYLRPRKTTGGHRRYRPDDVERLRRIHHLTHELGRPLKEVRETLISELDPVCLRRDLDLLLEVFESLVQENVRLHQAIQELTERVVALEEERRKRRFKLF
ncbi:MAG: MerR family transcriptional regulator [Acidobacteriota bacterium]